MNAYQFAVELRHARTLKVSRRKKKNVVIDGVISYPVGIWPPHCKCSKFRNKTGCRHTFTLLMSLGWSEQDLRCLPHAIGPEPNQSVETQRMHVLS